MNYYKITYSCYNGSFTTNGIRIVKADNLEKAFEIVKEKVGKIHRFIDINKVEDNMIEKTKALNKANRELCSLPDEWIIEIFE